MTTPEEAAPGALPRPMCECPKCGRQHWKLANKPLAAISGPSLLQPAVTAPSAMSTPEEAARRIIDALRSEGNSVGTPSNRAHRAAYATISHDEAPIVARALLAAEARIRVLEEALRSASAFMTCCMAVDCYSHAEIEEMARETKPYIDRALAKPEEPI